jgi:DMSO/TMAO reductase YedYZ molybdopterin-dependent catalytic subunit
VSPRYIYQDEAKCYGNPLHDECGTCLRKTLPTNPASVRQVWIGPWVLDDEPCPSRWTEEQGTERRPS